AMQNYTQKFVYDKIGNILQMKSVNNWTRDYFYPTANNMLIGHTDRQIAYTYDAHGNMLTTTIPHIFSLVYN
ncbi:MAG: hypothetical protein KAI79_12110, partial [Bacteroidales bacterium]|nr:hypothetical protein [Bacteroidales bacterium]